MRLEASKKVLLVHLHQGAAKLQAVKLFSFFKDYIFLAIYRTRANKGRGLYSKNIFWAIIAAINQERLLFENHFSHQFSLYTQIRDTKKNWIGEVCVFSLILFSVNSMTLFHNTATIPIFAHRIKDLTTKVSKYHM